MEFKVKTSSICSDLKLYGVLLMITNTSLENFNSDWVSLKIVLNRKHNLLKKTKLTNLHGGKKNFICKTRKLKQQCRSAICTGRSCNNKALTSCSSLCL